MNRPSPAQIETARRLLAHEGAAASDDSLGSTAAGRVYNKLHDHLAPLVGVAGVQSLFVRSAKIARREFAQLAQISVLDGSTKIHERLTQEPAIPTESAAVLFGIFFDLVTTFIGERLTTQVLRRAWPTIAVSWEMNT